jgi:predicted nucleic acid-binding protein
MKLILDTSVIVAGVRAGEPGHAATRPRLVRVLTGADVLVMPAILPIEEASALARRGVDLQLIRRLVADLRGTPHEVVALTAKRANAITDVALACKLRAADASYVWLAESRALPLYTLDDEMLSRGAVLGVQTLSLSRARSIGRSDPIPVRRARDPPNLPTETYDF